MRKGDIAGAMIVCALLAALITFGICYENWGKPLQEITIEYESHRSQGITERGFEWALTSGNFTDNWTTWEPYGPEPEPTPPQLPVFESINIDELIIEKRGVRIHFKGFRAEVNAEQLEALIESLE